jgi:SAM-dependent methyltransferase
MNTVVQPNDPVRQQYERWPYPQPIEDLGAWLQSNWQWFDPSHAHLQLWPDRPEAQDLEILIAGCGTNQAAVFATTNPTARVVGIDVSQSGLAHESHLKEKYGLSNLELRELPIEDAHTLKQDFDLIVSTGVLHHLVDPDAGLHALSQRLKPLGCMALMVYGHYGRLGVALMQELFAELNLQKDGPSLQFIRDSFTCIDPLHPLRSYLAIAPDLHYDAGLIDTFLNARERSYTVSDCLALVSEAGLVFQDWFFKEPYHPVMAQPSSNGLLNAIAQLSPERQWAAMERIKTRNACHFLLACKPGRPSQSYRLDFAGSNTAKMVPSLRWRCRIDGDQLITPQLSIQLNMGEQTLVQRIDGSRSVSELTGATDLTAASAIIQRLWLLDALDLALPPSGNQ